MIPRTLSPVAPTLSSVGMTPSLPPASIIVPTFREAANIKPLVERTFAALAQTGRRAEMIFVDDDSRDGTESIVAEVSEVHPIRLVVRRGERGLSSAVLTGFGEAKYDRFVVLDADLQHPPEMVPALLDRLDDEACDFVIGTRYGPGGAIEEHWPLRRRLASRLATLLARPLAPISDPMSGFFALRREIWARAAPLNPIGYKIALELYVKGRCRCPAEVPIRFGVRSAGDSKFGFREQLGYGRHLLRLYRFRFPLRSIIAIIAVPLLVLTAIAFTLRATVR